MIYWSVELGKCNLSQWLWTFISWWSFNIWIWLVILMGGLYVNYLLPKRLCGLFESFRPPVYPIQIPSPRQLIFSGPILSSTNICRCQPLAAWPLPFSICRSKAADSGLTKMSSGRGTWIVWRHLATWTEQSTQSQPLVASFSVLWSTFALWRKARRRTIENYYFNWRQTTVLRYMHLEQLKTPPPTGHFTPSEARHTAKRPVLGILGIQGAWSLCGLCRCRVNLCVSVSIRFTVDLVYPAPAWRNYTWFIRRST